MKNLNRVHDLTGQKFGRLTVIGLDDSKQTRKTYWICQCDCGNIKSIRSDALLMHRTVSCGCWHNEVSSKNVRRNHTHKQSGTRLYKIWQGMKGRCSNPTNTSYKNYGGRGITVCEEWQNSFERFYEWACNNGYSDDLTIDRANNNKGYSPDNCRWRTSKDQCRNRRSNVVLRIGNTAKSLIEWCEIFNLDYQLVSARYHRMIDNGDVLLDDLFKANTEINK